MNRRDLDAGAVVDDCVIYHNVPVSYPEEVPAFDAVFFASASAVEAYEDQWGISTLSGKTVAAIGQPTLCGLKALGVPVDVVGPEATVASTVTALALRQVNAALGTLEAPGVRLS